MQPIDDGEKRQKLNVLRSFPDEMPETDSSAANVLLDCTMFPIEDIVQYPLPGYGAPTSISFSPDDSLIAYLFSPDQSLYRKAFIFDPNSGKHDLLFSPPDGGLDENNLSAEEKLRRERSRERGLGVTCYQWVKRSSGRKRITVLLPAGIYVQDIGALPELKLPTASFLPIIDPHVSPDGSMLAYVRNNELHVFDFLYDMSQQLTYGANENSLTRGLAEYIAQEEMDRKNGYWWSLDSKYIAFTEVDSSEMPLYRIMHQGNDSVGSDSQEDHAYPFAGSVNVKVRLGVISATGGSVSWMDLLCGEEGQSGNEEYLARVNWMHGDVLTAQILNRKHTRLKILKFDIKMGQRKVILEEEHETWINLDDCFTPLERVPPRSSAGFIWASEKTGFRHLYLHDFDGICLGPITQGDWMVEQVSGVDEASGVVYFTGTLDGPLESHLYRTNMFPDAGDPLLIPLRLTQEKGKHLVVLDHQLQRFVDIHDSLGSPPKITVKSLVDGSLITSLYEQPVNVPRFKELQLEFPEIIQLDREDGTTLYGALYKPDAARFGPPPYKTMIQVYGGPGLQLVCDSWISTVDMRAQYLRSKGILVWKMDNRGSARRRLKFEGALKYKCGEIDAEDQISGAEWLMKQGLAKAGHIGLYGWSYGGYLSAMMLAKFPKVFRCAVSGAPVTSWDGYDTFYTEKYMGLPDENESGYLQSSVMQHIEGMKGKLLLVHGMIDENVHFRHTARLVNALVDAGKPYDLLIFPDERHMPRRHRDRTYMEERIWDFIQRNL